MNIEVTSPFPFEALPRIWRWIETFRLKLSDDFAPQTQGEFLEKMAAEWPETKTWAISADGELGGIITFRKLNAWVGTAHTVFKPEFQGKGIAIHACRAAVAAMFAEGIGKLNFYPLAGNLAIGSLLINIGAKREGTLRDQTLQNGVPVSVWLYGLTKKEFEEHAHSSVRNTGVDIQRRSEDDQNHEHRNDKLQQHGSHERIDHADILA